MDMDRIMQALSADLVLIGLKLLGAGAFFVVGRVLISLVLRLVTRSFQAKSVDATLLRYTTSVLGVALNIVLVVGLLGYFGIETTSFAALLGAAGIAIGAAWGGLLTNFAAGAFLVLLRPFKVGDYVVAAGVEGTVKEIALFTSTIQTPDDVETIVGNNRVFSDTIKNFTTNPTRRVERTALVAHEVDVKDAIARLKEALAKIPNVAKTPAPEVWIWDFNLAGTVLAVRPHCHTDHYWQVYADTNAAIASTFGVAGYPTPAIHEVQRQSARAA
ncbi:MAG: mechanosensitive ion channel family protein [Deltaproteobacteria bacterium]|nr:mechanosensitive ion channel family protein [Deltaproteobacteria bacterium]